MLILSNLLMVLGCAFILIAALGLTKFKDIYLQAHAATKAATLGTGLLLLGVALNLRSSHAITNVVLVIFFIALTSPISGHLIAKAAYRLAKQNKP